jgi:4-alpha-glucanotransferase
MAIKCETWLRKAARMWGIQPDYFNFAGENIEASRESLIKALEILSSQKVTAENAEAIIRTPREEKVTRMLEPTYVQKKSGEISVSVFFPEGDHVDDFNCRVRTEDGAYIKLKPQIEITPKLYPTTKGIFRRAILKAAQVLPLGYHDLEFLNGDKVLAKTLLLCPAHGVDKKPPKAWGLFTPLYALRDDHTWGIGDLEQLEKVRDKVQEWGGSFVGTLPLLANEYQGPHKDVSPYSPISKLFWNEIFLNIPELVAETPYWHQETDLQEIQEEVKVLNSLSLVNYEQTYTLKKKVLKKLSRKFFAQTTLDPQYLEYLNANPLVENYAEFRAQGDLAEKEFHLYCQFKLDRKMRGLRKGLYLDFPVGCQTSGFDSTYFKKSFVQGFSVGAPPDFFFRNGQSWGFEPLNSLALRQEKYDYFIRAIRHHMQCCEILRLDHVMALRRLYVIPPGLSPQQGVYLRYNADELFTILAIEAARYNVQVIGENLGTVPEAVQSALKQHHFYGMWVLPFQESTHPTEDIKNIPAENLICLNTHDLIPFAGYLQGNDLKTLGELGLMSANTLNTEMSKRRTLISDWKRNLFERDANALLTKMVTLLATSPAQLLLINVEDLWMETKPQNIPGTSFENPNWKHKLKHRTDDWTNNPDIHNFCRSLTQLRRKREIHGNDAVLGRSLSF